MSSISNPSLFSSVKGKVLLGFFIAALALGCSWFISNLAFKKMQTRLDDLSRPNDKLRLVNKVFKNILQLDNLQNARSIMGVDQKKQIIIQSNELIAVLDSLRDLSLDDAQQIQRLDSMKHMLKERDIIFGNYIKVRSRLVSNEDLSDEVQSISDLITTNKAKPDSTVVKTAKSTITTITEIPDSSKKVIAQQEKKRKWRFFNKKNKIEPAVIPSKFIKEQVVNVEIDTLTITPSDSTINKVDEAVQSIEKSQKQRTNRFVNREQQLATAGNSLVRQLLEVMQKVESDIVRKSDKNSAESQRLVTKNLDNIMFIMLGFLTLTAVLAYLIFSDITKSNQYRSQLEEAKEEAEYHGMAKQRFLSNMSHEIRTPLQSIIGYTESLKKDEKPKQQDLNNLHSASEHLLYLVNEVLDYSRIVSDQFTFENRTFAITPLLEEVIQMLQPTAKQKGLALSFENKLSNELCLTGDPFRLRQILYNLLTNAIKFTDEGEVILRATGVITHEQITLDLQISDTGIGLSPEQLQRVFNQFEQADASISRRYGGTGLGLSIVKSLVEAMNGNIHVKSNLGSGTTFFVKVIVPVAEMLPLASEKVEEKAYEVRGKVWLVDDDAFILKWCSSVLSMHNIDHAVFSSAEDAANAHWDNDVKFVLTDMRMPGMNGAELCQRLRKVASSSVKFYVLTAQALPEERAKLLNLGFDGILMKPFHSNDLLELLEKHSVKEKISTDKLLKPSLDFSMLNDMTFGDESILREILEQFVKDSKKDLLSLQHFLENSDHNNMHEIMHRMAGRTGQIGAKDLSAKFRKYEIAIRENKQEIPTDELIALIRQAEDTIDQVEEQVVSYSM